MKTLFLVGTLALTFAAEAVAAGWGDVRPGQSEQGAREAVGEPLIVTSSRPRGHATWTYDQGGYIQFEAGRVRHWNASRGGVTGAMPTAAVAATPSTRPSTGSVPAPDRARHSESLRARNLR